MKTLSSLMLSALLLVSILAFPAYAVGPIDGEITPIDSGTIYTPDNPAHPYYPSPGENSPDWSSSSPNSTHRFITQQAVIIVKNSYPTYPLTSYTPTLKQYSDYPDQSGSGQTDYGTFKGHFYNPVYGTNLLGETYPTAKDRLVWWYNNAVTKYNNGNISGAMESLGCALHYVADLSEPHHASNQDALTSTHSTFEAYAQQNQNSYIVSSAPSTTFTWAKNTSIANMGHNFAVNAKDQVGFTGSVSTFAQATQNTLPKAQRNAAAVLYKFLVDVGELS